LLGFAVVGTHFEKRFTGVSTVRNRWKMVAGTSALYIESVDATTHFESDVGYRLSLYKRCDG
jgi:hypothetical protein